MQVVTGNWEGTLMSNDGAEEPFVLSQATAMGDTMSAMAFNSMRFAITLDGEKCSTLRLLEGARSVLVALADAVPNPISGRCERLLVEARVRGDRMVGQWLRRDDAGVVCGAGSLSAMRK